MFCSSIHSSLFPCFFAPICLSSRRQAGRPEVHVGVWLYVCSGANEQEGVGNCTAPVPPESTGAANGKFEIDLILSIVKMSSHTTGSIERVAS